MIDLITRPDRSEAGAYYFTYIDQVPEGDIRTILQKQTSEVTAALNEISEARSLYRYAPDKWSLREVLNHLNDCERLFVGRAFWFARGFDTLLPSFDQNVAIGSTNAHTRSWHSHVEEFGTIRAATISFFGNLPDDAWARRGIASDNPFTVRALAYVTAGHVAHHMAIVREKYLRN